MTEYDPYDTNNTRKKWYQDCFFGIISTCTYIDRQVENGKPPTKFLFYECGDSVVMYDNSNVCCVLQCTRISDISTFTFCKDVKDRFNTVDYFKDFKRDVYYTASITQVQSVNSFDITVDYDKEKINTIQFIDPKTGNSAIDMGMQIIRQLDKKPEYLVVDSSGKPIRDNSKLQELKVSLENILKNDLNQNPPIYGIQHPLFTAYTTALVQESLLEKTGDIKSLILFEIPSVLDFNNSNISNLLSEKSSENITRALDFEGGGGSGRHFVTYLKDRNDTKFFDSSGALNLEKKQLVKDVFPQEGNTCGYWTAFFCAEVIKYDSIQEVEDNFDEILLKTAARVSEFIDCRGRNIQTIPSGIVNATTLQQKKPAILFDRPKDLNKFLYKPYNYTSGNPPQTKTVFILNDSDPGMKSQCVNLNAIRTMLNNKYKQPKHVDITEKYDSKQSCYHGI